jgi:protein SCO1/2
MGQYFGHGPVVLVLGYYRCPMLCSLVLNGMLESAADMRWSIGREYQVINVSIDPRESSTVAAGKRRTYLKRYGRPVAGQGWHFLTGSQQSIERLSQQVGFHYVYDPVSKEYAHPSGLIVLTPEGKLSSYLFGVTFVSKDLYAALQRASVNQVSSPIQQFILLCFHYNPITGKYSMTILSVLRLLGLVTVLALAGYILTAARRTRTATPTAPQADLSPNERFPVPVENSAAPNPASKV